jgi:hypothetical protein
MESFMKTNFQPLRSSCGKLATVLCLLAATIAARAQTAATATNSSAASLPPLPKSVFLIPSTPKQGKDPFFPRSSLPYALAPQSARPTAAPTGPAPGETDLVLNGLSRANNRQLAIINNQTFAAGEEGDVKTAKGKAHIRCLEIRRDTVLILIAGETRSLYIRPGS